VSWQIVLSDRARRDLRSLDRAVAARVVLALERLAQAQRGNVKRLQMTPPTWRLRVGDWRVLFRYDYQGQTVRVLRILPRGRAYRD
jgi:mRNA interferase RelE/StbE